MKKCRSGEAASKWILACALKIIAIQLAGLVIPHALGGEKISDCGYDGYRDVYCIDFCYYPPDEYGCDWWQIECEAGEPFEISEFECQFGYIGDTIHHNALLCDIDTCTMSWESWWGNECRPGEGEPFISVDCISDAYWQLSGVATNDDIVPGSADVCHYQLVDMPSNCGPDTYREWWALMDYEPDSPGLVNVTVTAMDASQCTADDSPDPSETVIDCIECWKLDGIDGDREVCPGYVGFYSAIVGGAPGNGENRIVNWEITGRCGEFDVDVEFDEAEGGRSCTVTVADGGGSGKFKLRAFDKDTPKCFFETVIEVGCSSCSSGSCQIGSGSTNSNCNLEVEEREQYCKAGYDCSGASGDTLPPMLESRGERNGFINFSIGLGKSAAGESLGRLEIVGSTPDTRLAKPSTLQYSNPDYSDVTVTECQSSGAIDLIEIVNIADIDITNALDDVCNDPAAGYEILFRAPNSGGTGEIRSGWQITAPDAQPDGSITTLRLKHYVIDDPTTVPPTKTYIENYDYVYDSQTETWSVVILDSVDNPLATEYYSESYDQQAGELTTKYEEYRDGSRYAKRITTYSRQGLSLAFGKIREEVYTDASDTEMLVTEWSYYPNGRLETQNNPDGSWVYWKYDEVLGTKTTIRPIGDAVWDSNYTHTSSEVTADVQYKQDAVSLGRYDDGWVELTTTYYAGTPIRQSVVDYLVYGEFIYEITDKSCSDLTENASYSAYGCDCTDITTTYYNDYSKGDIDYIESANKQSTDIQTYADRNIAFNSLEWSWYREYNQSGYKEIERVTKSNSSTVNGKSTRQITFVDPTGRSTGYVNYVDVGGSWYETDWSVTVYDDSAGNSGSTTYHSDGSITSAWGCCLTTNSIDSNGRQRSSERDELGRTRIASEHSMPADIANSFPAIAAIDTTVDYMVQNGRRVEVTKSYAGGSALPYSETRREYDLAGRLLLVQSEGVATSYEYNTAAGGGQEIVEYLNHVPGAATKPKTRTTTYYRDGRVISVTGSAIVPEYHDYGLASTLSSELSLVQPLTGVTYVRVRQGAPNSERFTVTVNDALGRTVESLRPGQSDGQNGTPIIITKNYYQSEEQTIEGQTVSVDLNPYSPSRGASCLLS